MRIAHQLRFIPLLVLLPFTACASRGPAQYPLTDVPLGTYQLVDPEPEAYTAVALNDRAWAVRAGDQVFTGTLYVDQAGLLHVIDDQGPCAGLGAVWEYELTGARLVMDLVSDECENRDVPHHWVWERR